MPKSLRSLLCAFLLAGTALAAAEPQIHTEFDTNPRPVRTPPPPYPKELAGKATTGVVLLAVVIDDRGDVQSTEVVKSSDPVFNVATADAVKRWKFAPAEKAGQRVWAKLHVPVHFSPDV